MLINGLEINRLSHLARSPGPGFTYVFTKAAMAKIAGDQQFKSYLYIDNSLQPKWYDWVLFATCQKLKLKWYIDKEGLFYNDCIQQQMTGLLSLKVLLWVLFFCLAETFKEK